MDKVELLNEKEKKIKGNRVLHGAYTVHMHCLDSL
jgi:hypothetical protein